MECRRHLLPPKLATFLGAGPQTRAKLGDLWMLRLFAGLGFVLILSLTLRIAGIEAV